MRNWQIKKSRVRLYQQYLALYIHNILLFFLSFFLFLEMAGSLQVDSSRNVIHAMKK